MGGWASGAPSILHRNMAFGKDSITTASTSMTSSFIFLTRSVRFFRSFPLARAAFLPNRVVLVPALVPALVLGLKVWVLALAVWNVDDGNDDGAKESTCWKNRHCKRRKRDFIIMIVN